MKINRSESSNIVSNQNMKQTEQKETVSKTQVHQDRFEALPSRNDTIGGGYQRKEAPKGKDSKPDGTTSESQPETPAWLKGKEQSRGIGWGKEVRPKDTSGTSVGSSGVKGKKVNLDYFDKQKQMKNLIGADESSLRNVDKGDGTTPGESKEPGRKNPFQGMEGGVPRGYGKNKSSKQEQASNAPTPYPAIKSETSDPSAKVKIGERSQKEPTTKPSSGDEAGTLKGMVSPGAKPQPGFTDFTFDGSTKTQGNSTPSPDAVDESHRPKSILAEKNPQRKDLATNQDKITLHDDNKRQQEKVSVERQEIFGNMVGRMTDGRSTPTPTDGTTDSAGPRPSTGTGGVDLESKHRKGDPGDGDEA